MPYFETSDGVKLYYEKEGERKNLLFIHGWGASRRFWKNQIEYFKKDYGVITVDLRGHGESSKDVEIDYSFNRLVSDITELVEYLDLNNYVYIGHSLGGMIGLKLATIDKNMKALITTGSPYQLKKTFGGFSFKIFTIILKLNRKLAGKLVTPKLFAPNTSHELLEFARKESAVIPVNVLIKIANVNKNLDLFSVLRDIKKPVLIIAGEFDKITPLDEQRKLTELIEDSKLIVLSKCGHNLMLEKPDEFNKVIEEYLEGINF